MLYANGPKCVLCGEYGREVDHVIPAWRGGSDAPSNLRVLCSDCHAEKTLRESIEAREHYRRLNRRPDRAPGRLR